jgi:tripartite-type tricarboxylate transporter receptor subunit TctC
MAAVATMAFSAASYAWEPKKPVDFVIMAGKGGGADKMARLMQSVIEKNKFASKPFVPINKPGGSDLKQFLHHAVAPARPWGRHLDLYTDRPHGGRHFPALGPC